ncbi:glycosyltransferase family 2 protein [Hydrocarboniclastica marina]|uniref:Glycosyltransferase n=1 Tax=Hydrocarboniclastica marina TaxID=2259620 RepID=A0A4P7XKL0_9ALTE|nr:glycosyltransferase [Hydrocarboniclastica marina]MAM00604.1 hypothetical protein [Alteromonadaceae bacterium]QCF26467.1 glycosyltransferase [Hydrocarboniclastica marina]|tara:strand:+ start:7278 stop:8225 length:948 start_codon:yes stop_codon:yes gene_type:complete
MANQDDIRVSVCVVTYNQENYISECLQSLVDQQTDFLFEIIVGEDCSEDSTRDIVEEFARTHPHLIVRNYHDKNVGAVENIVTSYRLARGMYISHLDGDDYASPGKLQAQYDALKANPDCVICSHDVKIVSRNGELIKPSFKTKPEGKYTLLELYKELPFFAHSSKMFVNDLFQSYWSDLHADALDIEVHVAQCKMGSIYHIDRTLGAYRSMSGMSVLNSSINPALVHGVDRIFKSALNESRIDPEALRKCYAKAMFNYAYQSALVGDKKGIKKYIRKSISISRYSSVQALFYYMSKVPIVVMKICKLRSKIKGY